MLIIREICNGKDINALTLNDFDFNVSKRTFQRDIKKVKDFFIEHFACIPIAVDSATHTRAYKMCVWGEKKSLYLDKSSSKDLNESNLDSALRTSRYKNDKVAVTFQSQKSIASYIKKFATLSGIKSLYPTLDEDFLSELLDDNINSIYDITQSNYEKINAELFNQIADAILNNEIVSFDYKEKQRIVKPYKLAHIKGIWYLIADENNKLKHFSFTKMQNIAFLPKRFYPKRAFLKQISDNQNLWLSSNPKSALIIINIKAKGYFLRKSLPKNITLIGYDDRKILIRYSFAFDDELFNFLKLWIPYAQIKEPKALQIRFNEMLEDYVGETRERVECKGEVKGENSPR